MVKVIRYLHKIVFCCNLDISLENVVLTRDTYFDETSGKIKNIDIRFIDFGLSEQFNNKLNPDFKCKKFVGKIGYQAPKVYHYQPFMANKADIWSLGCALFVRLYKIIYSYIQYIYTVYIIICQYLIHR